MVLDQLQRVKFSGFMFSPSSAGDLVEVVEQVAAERVLDAALDEGDGDQALSPVTGSTCVERVRRIDDGFAGLQLEHTLRRRA